MKKKFLTIVLFCTYIAFNAQNCVKGEEIFQAGANFGTSSLLTYTPSYNFYFTSILKKNNQDKFFINSNLCQTPVVNPTPTITQRNFKMLEFDKNNLTYLNRNFTFEDKDTRIFNMSRIDDDTYFLSGSTRINNKSKGLIKIYDENNTADKTYQLTENQIVLQTLPVQPFTNDGDVIVKTIKRNNKIYSVGYTKYLTVGGAYNRIPIMYIQDGTNQNFYYLNDVNLLWRPNGYYFHGAITDIIANENNIYIIGVFDGVSNNAHNQSFIYKVTENRKGIELNGHRYLTDSIAPSPWTSPPVFFSKMSFNNAKDKITVLFRYGSHKFFFPVPIKYYGGLLEFDLDLNPIDSVHFALPVLPLCKDYINGNPPSINDLNPDVFLSCMQFDNNDNILIGGLYKNYSHTLTVLPATLLGSITFLYNRNDKSYIFGYEEGITTQVKEIDPFFKVAKAVNSNSLDNVLPDFIALNGDKEVLHIVGTQDELDWETHYPAFTKSILKHKARKVQDYYDAKYEQECDTCNFVPFIGQIQNPKIQHFTDRNLYMGTSNDFSIETFSNMQTEAMEDYITQCKDTIRDTVSDCFYDFEIKRKTDTLCKNSSLELKAVPNTPYWNQEFLWSTGETTPAINVTNEGIYTVEWTRHLANGRICKKTKSVFIHKPIDASIETLFNIDEVCQGETLNLRAYPKFMPIYEWYKDGNYILYNTLSIDVTTPGTYTVKVTMENGCVDEVSKEIYQKGLTLKQTASKTTPALNETITLTGKVCNYETKTATNVPFESVLPAGFDFVGSSVAGLSFNPTTRKITYTIPSIAARVGNNVPCIDISYQVKATNLCKVNHCMQVTSTACDNLTITDCKDYNSQPIHSVAITAPRFEVCNNNTITMNTVLNPLAGTTTFQWKLNGNDIPNATTNTYTTSNVGLYTVSATRNNCTVVSEAKEVKESTPIVPNATVVDNLCLGKTNGSISLAPTGGSAPYTYQWSNSATTSTISNLAVGNYTVTVKDKYNCTVSNSYVIKHQKAISFTFGIVNPSYCNMANGAARMIVGIDATFPISFKNMTNNTDIVNTDASNLKDGIYTIRMTDANGCIVENDVTIGRTNIPFEVDITKTALCSATPDGKIVLSPKGLAPYTYLWNNGSTTATVNNLATGSYTVTVTDANLCTTTKTIDIVPSPAIGTPTISSSIISCMPNDNKSIYTATFTGGVAPFTYQWSPSPISTNANTATINTNTGNISITITDANGCKKTSSTIANSLSSYTQLGEGYSKPTRSGAASLFPSNVLNSNKVVIKGNFTIDQAATIQNAEVILENYPTSSPLKLGKITSTLPNTSGDFKLINCTVKTCNNELAEGIEINNSNIWMQGNKVYDMITALSFKNNVKLFLNSNLFENNRIGIEYATTVGTLTTFTGPNPSLLNHFTNNSFIGGNLKTNRNASISQYQNTIGGNTNYSYIGIASRNNLGFNIGKSSSLLNPDGSYSQIYPMNTFYKINNGIVVSQGNYNIVNFRIYDYNDEVVPPITPTKKGIVAINTANIEPTVAIGAKIVVKGENNSTQFFSLTKAVETFGYELELSNSIFHFIENNAIEYTAYSNRTSNKFNISYNNFISTKNQAFNYIDNSNKPTFGIFSNNKVNGIGTTNNALINFNKIQLTASTSESLAVQFNEIKNFYNRISLNINNFRNVNYTNNTHISNGTNVNITATISNCNTYNESNNIYNTTYTGSGKNDPIISNSFSTNNIYPLDALYDNNVNATISCNDYNGFSNILFSKNQTNLNLTNNDFTGKKHRILIDANCTFPPQSYKGNRFSLNTSNGTYDIFSKVSSSTSLFVTKYSQVPINTSNYVYNSSNTTCSGIFYFFPSSLRRTPVNVMGTILNSNINEPYSCCTPMPKTVRADGLNDEKNNTKLSIYPNPTTDGEVNIEFPSEINSKISFYLFDLNANKVFFEEQNIEGKKAKISINGISSGYYILRIFNGNEHLQDEKINFKMREF